LVGPFSKEGKWTIEHVISWWNTHFPEIPLHLKTYEPSVLFRKYFKNADFIARVNRAVKFNDNSKQDTFFKKFIKDNKVEYHEEYGYAQPTIDSGYLSASSFVAPQPLVKPREWLLACKFLERTFFPIMGYSNLTSDHVVISHMKSDTSTGFPLNLKYHLKGDFIKRFGLKWFRHSFFCLSKQVVPPSLWQISQKYEMRTLEKLRDNNIRTFLPSDVLFVFNLNKFCLDMNEKLYADPVTTPSFLGGTKYRLGFHRLYQRLRKHPNFFEWDLSKMDRTLFAQSLRAVRDFRWSCIEMNAGPGDKERFFYLYDQIIHSLCVCEAGDIFQKHGGNPSGSANTATDNTLAMFVIVAYMWICLAPEGMKDYESFRRELELACYSDDGLNSVSDKAKVFWNPSNLKKEFLTLGLVLKIPSSGFVTYKDCTFLSHKVHCVEMYGSELLLPYLDYNKCISSMIQCPLVDDVRYSLMRASAVLQEGWYNLQLRNVLRSYINYVLTNYRSYLVGVVRDIDMQDIINSLRSDSYYESLYLGHEGLCSS